MRSLVLPILLAGCSQAVDTSPSLLPRAVEKAGFVEPAVVPPGPVVADPALDAQIARRGNAVDAAQRAFDTAIAAAAPRIARGSRAAVGSENWIDAQSLVGELGQSLSTVEGAMSELEELAIVRASAGTAPYPALDARIAATQGRIDAATRRLDDMKAALPGG